MKKLMALLALSAAFGMAACDGPQSNEPEIAEAPMDAPLAPAADDASAPAAAPSAVDTPPADSTTLPSEKRSSEESVRPESETLFY